MTDRWAVQGEAVLLGDEADFIPAWLVVEDGLIVRAGTGRFPGSPDVTVCLPLAPGLVDIHCHGGGGAAFADGPEAAQTALAAHLDRGTSAVVASLVTADWEQLMAQVEALRPLVDGQRLVGLHLEGPWLAPGKRGAHDPAKLVSPTPEQVAQVVARADLVRQVTIAPELPGAMAAIAALSQAGVVAAIGHTEADRATTAAAIAAGARGATHLFNAMPELAHRAPGPVLALLSDPRVVCELILDGHHVDPELALATLRLLGRRAVLVTDAMAAAGLGDGAYQLGGLPVTVRHGVARLTDDPGHAIAGSTIRLSDAVALAVAGGLPLARAVAAATRQPADHLGLTTVGRIAVGQPAELVEFDWEGRFRRVLRFD